MKPIIGVITRPLKDTQDRSVDTKDYVLGNIGKEDMKKIVDKFSEINKIIEEFDYSQINELMGKYN